MVISRELARSASFSLLVIGAITLFYSFAMLVVDPQAEHTAFPWPLGVPALVMIAVAAMLYTSSVLLKPTEKAKSNQ